MSESTGMTREQLEGAIAALEAHAATFLPITCAEEKWAYGQAHLSADKLRAQLAALPPSPWTDRERRLREALEIAECYSLRWHKNLSAFARSAGQEEVMANFELIRTALSEPAPPPSPDLRAALVEAREALKVAADALEGWTVREAFSDRKVAVHEIAKSHAAIARIDAALESK